MSGSKPVRARFSINVLENDRHEILLLKRAPGARLGAGMWGFPAGHIKNDESPDECADRELKEEIGPDFKTTLVKRFGPVRDTHYGGKYEIYLFHRQWITGSICLNHEHSDYAWISQSQYLDYDVMAGIDEDLEYLKIWKK